MPSKRHYATQFRNQIKRDLLETQLKPRMERAGKQIERIATKILRASLRYSSQRGATGLRDASIQSSSRVELNMRRGATVIVNLLVVDDKGKPHFVWHIIAFGRPAFTQRRTSPPIRERKGMRTKPRRLEVEGFPGFTGKNFVVRKGTRVRGIKARRWYQIAGRKLRREIKKYPSLQVLELRVVKTRVRRP